MTYNQEFFHPRFRPDLNVGKRELPIRKFNNIWGIPDKGIPAPTTHESLKAAVWLPEKASERDEIPVYSYVVETNVRPDLTLPNWYVGVVGVKDMIAVLPEQRPALALEHTVSGGATLDRVLNYFNGLKPVGRWMQASLRLNI